jgi:DNA-binding beta-propeller fold protein YncE
VRRLPLACALALAGCGSAPVAELPPPAGPAASPPLAARPLGRSVPVGGGASSVAFDPLTGLVAVAVRDPAALVLVDGRSGAVRRRVPQAGAPARVALADSGGPVLVPVPGAGALVQVSLLDARVTTTRVGGRPTDAAGVGRAVLLAGTGSSSLSLLAGGRTVARARTGARPVSLATLDGGELVSVIAGRARTNELYDARTLQPLGRASAGVGPTHVATDGDRIMFVTDTRGDGLLIFRRRPFELTRRVPLPGGPYAIAVDRARRRLWVTLTERNAIAELTANGRPRVLRELPVPRQPDGVAVDPLSGRVFVTGRRAGVLQLLDPPAMP